MADWIIAVLLSVMLMDQLLDHHDRHTLEDIARSLREIVRLLRALVVPVLPIGGVIEKLGGNMTAGSNSIDAGGSGTFQVTPTPAGTSVPSADKITFAANDPEVGIAASPDGDPTKCVVSVPATDKGTSFVLACQFSGPDFPTPVNCTPLQVAIVQPTPPPPPPPPPLPTGGTIAQVA